MQTLDKELSKAMKVGDRVRVSKSVVVYHNPENRGEATDIQGMEGEIVAFANDWQGHAISANFPIYVQFSKRFKAHLRDDEVTLVDA